MNLYRFLVVVLSLGSIDSKVSAIDGDESSKTMLTLECDSKKGSFHAISIDVSIEKNQDNTKKSLSVVVYCNEPSHAITLDREVSDLSLKFAFLKDHGHEYTVSKNTDSATHHSKNALSKVGAIAINIPLEQEKINEDVLRGIITTLKDHFYLNEDKVQQLNDFLEIT